MANRIILEAKDLKAGYGGSLVLNGVSLQVREATITGIVGPNGAGKSTILKTILGYLNAVEGSVILEGRDITKARPDQRIADGIAYVAQTNSGFMTLTIRENLRLGAYLVKDKALIAERESMVLQQFPELQGRLSQPASDLSGGQRRMLEIGRFLMQGPTMVILDEPSIGLSPKLINLAYHEIIKLRDKGMSFLIVEQNVKKLLEVADYVYAYENGQNFVEGTPTQLQEDEVLKNLFLGGTARPPATKSLEI